MAQKGYSADYNDDDDDDVSIIATVNVKALSTRCLKKKGFQSTI
jgi:hypothetical protein